MRRYTAYLSVLFSILFFVGCSGSKTVTNVSTPTPPDAPETPVLKLDRSQPPAAGPAPVIQLGDYQFFELENGLKVYVVQNDKLPRVAYSLQIDRDPIFEGDKAGYIGIMGDLMTRGTTSKSKVEIDESIDFIGASFSTYSSGMFGSSLTKHSQELLKIMNDVLMNPSFPEEEMDKLIKIMKSNLLANKEDPGAIVDNIRGLVVYGEDHPYGEMESDASLSSITRKDVVDFYNKYWSPQNAYMAVVGDITLEEARKNVQTYFGEWKGEAIPEHEYKTPESPGKNKVILIDRPQSVQSEIRICYPVEFKTSSEDFFAAKLMNQILGVGFSSRLLQNLREDNGYTYSAGSGLGTNEVISRFTAGAAVRNEVTDSAVHEFLFELNKIVDEGVTEQELKSVKAYITGSFARSLEDPETIASFAINTAVKNLPADFYQNYLKSLNAVTLEEVNAAAKKYIHPGNAYIVIVGKASEIEDKIKVFGPITQYDADGNIVEKDKLNAALAGMSPQAIMDKYINAVGGVENMMKVGNQKQTWEISAYGQTLQINSVKTVDGKFRTDVVMGGSVQQSIICDGKDIVTLAGGNKMPMDDESKESEIINNRLFPELYYGKSEVKLKLSGMEKVDGREAFLISIIYPSGKESQAYFDTESGLKLKETTSIETPQGSFAQTATYKDYKAIDGVLYAHTTSMTMGPQVMESTMTELINNSEVNNDTFAIGE